MQLPNSIPALQLIDHPNSGYVAEDISLYSALYDAKLFEKTKKQYLRPRKSDSGASGPQRELTSYYPAVVSGLVDWLASAVMQSPPAIEAEGPDEKIKYYHDLVQSADGRRDLAAITRKVLNECLVQERSYFVARFPSTDPELFSNLKGQKENGALDAMIGYLCATDVDDWLEDEYSNLQWVRTHTVDLIRDLPYGPYLKERHTFTFIDADECREYIAERELDNTGTPKDWSDADVARLSEVRPHNLGAIPIVEVEIPDGLHVVGRLAGIALAHFNRVSSQSFALDTSALALPYVKTNKDIKSIVANELSVLVLQPGDEFGFATPESGHFAALRQDAKDLYEAMFNAIQAMALSSQMKTQSPRQPAASKSQDMNSLLVLLQTFGDAIRDALEQTLELIRQAREDNDVTIKVTGLDSFALSSADDIAQLAQLISALPGCPESLRKWIFSSLARTVCADPDDLREILADIDTSEKPEPPAPVIVAAPNGAPPAASSDNEDDENKTENDE